MRLVANISHPRVKIAIMSYNDKWIIEIEGGQYKQTYKIGHDSVNGVEDVKKLITEELLDGTMERFGGMHKDFGDAFKKLNSE